MELAEDYFEYTNQFFKLILPLLLILILGAVVGYIIDYLTDDSMLPFICGIGFWIGGFIVCLIWVTIKANR